MFCAPGATGSETNLEATAKLALELLVRCQSDQELQQSCRTEAQRRLGAAGGAVRMARAISSLLP